MGAKAPQPLPDHLCGNKPTPPPPPPKPPTGFGVIGQTGNWPGSSVQGSVEPCTPSAPRLMAATDRPFSPAERERLQLQLTLAGERGSKPVVLDDGVRVAQFVDGEWKPVLFSGEATPATGDGGGIGWSVWSFLTGVLAALSAVLGFILGRHF